MAKREGGRGEEEEEKGAGNASREAGGGVGGVGGLACSAQLRGKRLRRTRAAGMEEQPGGGRWL